METENQLPEGWENSNIDTIARYIQRGKSPKYISKSALPVINQKCIRWHGLDVQHLKYIHPDQWEKWDEIRYVQPFDILWNSTGTGTIGRAALYRNELDKTVVDSHVTIVRLWRKYVSPEYVWYYIMSPHIQKKIEDMQSGSTNQVELGKTVICETEIPLAPLPEQRRIVDKIEELFSALDDGEANLQKVQTLLARYRQSVLRDAMSGKIIGEEDSNWRRRNIGKLITNIRYGTSKKCVVDPSKTPVLRIPNVVSGKIELSDLKHADFSDRELEKLSLREGDVLIVRSNGSASLVARSAVVDNNAEGCLYAGYLIRLRLDRNEILPHYLHLFFHSPAARLKIEGQARSTSGVHNINSSEVKALSLKVPPLNSQQEIIEKVNELFSQIDVLESWCATELTRSNRLRQSVLKDAFSGKLVPQDPTDEPASELLKRIQAEREAEAAKTKKPTKRKTKTKKTQETT